MFQSFLIDSREKENGIEFFCFSRQKNIIKRNKKVYYYQKKINGENNLRLQATRNNSNFFYSFSLFLNLFKTTKKCHQVLFFTSFFYCFISKTMLFMCLFSGGKSRDFLFQAHRPRENNQIYLIKRTMQMEMRSGTPAYILFVKTFFNAFYQPNADFRNQCLENNDLDVSRGRKSSQKNSCNA